MAYLLLGRELSVHYTLAWSCMCWRLLGGHDLTFHLEVINRCVPRVSNILCVIL